MKAISIWRAPAHLLVRGFKICETRGWPLPAAQIGVPTAIAATKQIKKDEKAWCALPEFQEHYARTELPPWEELTGGCIIGTVVFTHCLLMTEEFIARCTKQELAFGEWAPGRFAWVASEREVFWTPVPVRGLQGLYDWDG